MTEIKDTENIYKYFPVGYDIRDSQKEIVPMVHDFLYGHSGDYDGMILSAAPGIGKEACFTSQALLALSDGLFDKVIFCIPTDAGKENILKELGAVRHGRKVVKLLSKDILCNWMKDTEDERIKALELESDGCAYYLCKYQGHKCIFKDHGCHYEEQKGEIAGADIIICDYNYIISPFIRRLSGFDEILNGRVLLLINECHMLRPRAEMILSSSISSTTIDRAIMELDDFGYHEEKNILKKIIGSIEKCVTSHKRELLSDMDKNHERVGEMTLKLDTVNNIFDSQEFGKKLVTIGENISNLKFESKVGIISYADIVGSFIVRFYNKIGNKGRVVFFLKIKDLTKDKNREKGKGKKVDIESKRRNKDGKDGDSGRGGGLTEYIDISAHVGWVPIDVRGFLRNAINMSDKYVLYSGTIKPQRLRNDVGLTYEKVLTPNVIESPFLNNRHDIILAKERFCQDNMNNKDFLSRITRDLDKMMINMDKPIGIVCTNRWYESLNLDWTYDILNEPKTQEEVPIWLKELVPNAGIIRFSPYGRVAQSVDMSCLKSIIFLGFPYPKYGAITRERIEIMAKGFKGKSGNRKSRATYVQMIEPAYEKIIQSAMRGLRNENDRLVVVYYDVNYKLNKPALGSKNLSVCLEVEDVNKIIKGIGKNGNDNGNEMLQKS